MKRHPSPGPPARDASPRDRLCPHCSSAWRTPRGRMAVPDEAAKGRADAPGPAGMAGSALGRCVVTGGQQRQAPYRAWGLLHLLLSLWVMLVVAGCPGAERPRSPPLGRLDARSSAIVAPTEPTLSASGHGASSGTAQAKSCPRNPGCARSSYPPPTVLDKWLGEFDFAADVRHWSLAARQRSWPGVARSGEPAPWAGPPRPETRFARVRGYGIAIRRYQGVPELLVESYDDGCLSGVLTVDGRLCPFVLQPGVELNGEQVTRLLKLAQPTRRRPVGIEEGPLRPAMAFVFYDERGMPVAQLVPCLRDGFWMQDATRLTREDGLGLVSLCRSLDLPLCGVDLEPCAETWWVEMRMVAWPDLPVRPCHGVQLPPTPTGVAEGQLLSELTEADKAVLCEWNVQHAAAADWPLHLDRWEHKGIAVLGWRKCVATFPRCARSVRDVLPCQRLRQLYGLAPALEQARPECAALVPCTWGFGATF
jgi:hypothetical protein